jgi:DNA polymerase III alpha subunit
MTSDKFGNVLYDSTDIVNMLYKGDGEHLSKVLCENSIDLSKLAEIANIQLNHVDPTLYDIDVETFDSICQNDWMMPEEYKTFDIAKWVLDKCENQDQLQRVGAELLEFQRRNMLPLLQWLKYFVDYCRTNNVVWGVGRGSSVSSYVLFLIGVHKIDSMKYNLDWQDFLR